jgi:hypothetical protein
MTWNQNTAPSPVLTISSSSHTMGNTLACIASTCMVLGTHHNSARSFKCHECTQTFNTNKKLKDHAKTHDDKFKCHKCSYCTYMVKAERDEHMKKDECNKKKNGLMLLLFLFLICKCVFLSLHVSVFINKRCSCQKRINVVVVVVVCFFLLLNVVFIVFIKCSVFQLLSVCSVKKCV